MKKPIVNEVFADNGEHSHWELVGVEDGDILWTETESPSEEWVGVKAIETLKKYAGGVYETPTIHDPGQVIMNLCEMILKLPSSPGIQKNSEDAVERIYRDYKSDKDDTVLEAWYFEAAIVEENKTGYTILGFSNFDGSGYWVKDGKKSRDEIFSTPRLDATHIVWYNK